MLARLQPGELVPPHIYISDYATGLIPEWTVVERERHGILTILTLIDPATPHTNLIDPTGYVAHEIFAAPERVLCSPAYLWRPGGIKRRNQFCDIRQEARKIAERLAGVKHGSYEPR